MKQKKQRIFRWALWTGLALYVLGSILTAELETDAGVELSPWLDQFGLWPVLVLAGVLIPLLEEVCFRLWAIGWRRGHRKAFYLVGSGLAAVYTGVGTLSWVAGAAALAVMLACTLVPRDDRRRTLLMLVATSMAFGITHAGNVETWEWSAGIYLLALAGSGLMAAYLVLNYGLLWSILLHMAINCTATLAEYYTPEEPVTLENDCREMEITSFREREYTVIERLGDTTWYRGTLPSIAEYLVWDQQRADSVSEYSLPVMHQTADGNWRLPTKQLRLVNRQGGTPDYEQALQMLMEAGLVKADTTYEPLWTLRVADTALASRATGSSSTPLWGIIIELQGWHRMPVMVAEGEDEEYQMHYSTDSLRIGTEQARLGYLERNGIRVEPDAQGRMMQVITFSAEDPL